MRKPFALFMVAALLAVVVWWWMVGDLALSVMPGWQLPILAPYVIVAGLVSAVMLAVAFLMLWKHFGGG
jgi:membrane associated rhomboid family serine protease